MLQSTWRNRLLAGFALLVALAIAWSWQTARRSRWQVRAVLEGHSDAVNCVAFSPDSSLLVSGGSDRRAKIWDVRTGREIGELHAEFSPPVWSVAVSPDQRRVATGGWMGEIDFWDLSSRRKTAGFRTSDKTVRHLAFGPEGKTLTYNHRWGMTVYDLTTWRSRASTTRAYLDWLRSKVFVTAFVLAPNTAIRALRLSNGEIHLLDAETLELRTRLVTDKKLTVGHLVASPDGRWLVSIHSDHSVRRWNTATGKLDRELGTLPARVHRVALAPDGDTLVYVTRRQQPPWWSRLPYLASVFKPKVHSVFLIEGFRLSSQDKMHVWEQSSSVVDLAYSPDGKLLAVCSSDRAITLFEVPR